MNNFQEQAESSSLNLNSTVSNIQELAEPAPLDFTTSITNNQEPAEPSPLEIILDLSMTRNTASTLDTASTVDTASTLDITTSSNTKESTASPKEPTIQELPLDLSFKPATKFNPKPVSPVEIPSKPLTPIIDCTVPTNIWNVKPLSLSTDNYEHLCLDPRDRNTNGGGVFIAIHDKITSAVNSSENDCELQWAEIQTKPKSVIIFSYYRPPNASIEALHNLKTSVSKVIENNKDKPIILAGDFNHPYFDWENNTVKIGKAQAKHHQELLELIEEFGMEQLQLNQVVKISSMTYF
ncbi:unnamed protein product [Mytilus coruscus]|uniref:Endonuclease/exonuclease/phosphatase domain-containing protein n=1 Tax=Mytilus coruscus TaxID=42192 RepID=A0A6J8BDC9_MYTCO|nr:unnamed protein product [Mytilus coruscus]